MATLDRGGCVCHITQLESHKCDFQIDNLEFNNKTHPWQ